MKTVYGLVGAGGHGKETMLVVREMLASHGVERPQLRFLVEPGYDPPAEIGGVPVIGFDAFGALPGEKRFNVAIGDGKARERLAAICAAAGWSAFTIAGGTSVVRDGSEMGEGAVLSPFTLISTSVRIGKFFLANAYACVMHDCVVGDYVTLMPGVRVNGTVTIGDHVTIGSGAIVRNGLTVGEGAVIGMGAVVTRDVAPYTTVIGNPARVMPGRVIADKKQE